MNSTVITPAMVRLIEMALDEDLAYGDITTSITCPDDHRSIVAQGMARHSMVVFGLFLCPTIVSKVDPTIVFTAHVSDGDCVDTGHALFSLQGSAQSILAVERTVLNFVQRLSGISTTTKSFVDLVAGTGAHITDTRKTTPAYRALEKAAVLAGGGYNHRSNLSSGILIKDNHRVVCGSVEAAIAHARKRAPHMMKIEIEVDTLEQLDEALNAGADVVLLDNMSFDDVTKAAKCAHHAGVLVEVSGGVTRDTVAGYAQAGADIISIGALTHSVAAADIGLDFIE